MKTKTLISDEIRNAIALKAYYIWEEEGRPEGRGAEHWARAEAEILREEAEIKPAPKTDPIKTIAASATAPKPKATKKAKAAKPEGKKPAAKKATQKATKPKA